MSFSASESFLADYQSLTLGCGTVSLDDWSTVSISGKNRANFVHNMCTNDIRRLTPGSGCETFFTNVQGKIVAHCFVFAREAELLLLGAPKQAASLIAHLDQYIIREDVQLRDDSQSHAWLLISGAGSSSLIKELTGFATAELAAPWQNVCVQFNAAEILLVRGGAIWPESFFLRYPKNDKDQLSTLTKSMCQASAWTALRVESVLPLLNLDFDQTNLPQEVNRNNQAISFNKGCYLGQETIARIDALGHVNQQIVCLRFDEDQVPTSGTELLSAEKKVGVATTCCWSPRLEAPLALARVRRGSNSPGCVLQSEFGQATVIDPSELPTL